MRTTASTAKYQRDDVLRQKVDTVDPPGGFDGLSGSRLSETADRVWQCPYRSFAPERGHKNFAGRITAGMAVTTILKEELCTGSSGPPPLLRCSPSALFMRRSRERRRR